MFKVLRLPNQAGKAYNPGYSGGELEGSQFQDPLLDTQDSLGNIERTCLKIKTRNGSEVYLSHGMWEAVSSILCTRIKGGKVGASECGPGQTRIHR